MLQCKIDIATKDKKARAGAIEYDEVLFEQLRRLRRIQRFDQSYFSPRSRLQRHDRHLRKKQKDLLAGMARYPIAMSQGTRRQTIYHW